MQIKINISSFENKIWKNEIQKINFENYDSSVKVLKKHLKN